MNVYWAFGTVDFLMKKLVCGYFSYGLIKYIVYILILRHYAEL